LTDAAGEAAKLPFNQWSAGFACSHCERLSALRASVEPRSEELSAIRLRHRNFLLDTRIFSEQISQPYVT
jgi:hypothetical protein